MPHFASLKVSNVGPIGSFDATFASTGLNIIYGPNESGRTHLAAILACCLTKSPLSFFRPRPSDSPAYTGASESSFSVVIRDIDGDGTFSMRTPQGIGDQSSPITFQDCPQAERLREILAQEPRTKFFWGSGHTISRPYKPNWEKLLSFVRLNSAAPAVADYFGRVSRIPLQNLSGGSIELLALAEAFEAIIDRSTPHPLIFDDSFGRFDEDRQHLLRDLLRAIAQRHQVILLTANSHFSRAFSSATRTDIEQQNQASLTSGLVLAAEPGNLIELAFEASPQLGFDFVGGKQSLSRTAAFYAERLDAAARADESDLHESFIGDLARGSAAITSQMLQGPLLEQINREVQQLLAAVWDRLHVVSRQHLSAARFLVSLDADPFLRLALLSVCISIETEIKDKVFVPFVNHVRASDRTYPEAPPATLAREDATSYTLLVKLINGSNPNLMLGSFPWILKAARKNCGGVLFGDLMAFLENRYGEETPRICGLVESIAFRGMEGDARINGQILNIRNACAHGRQEPFESGAAHQLFDLVWDFAFKEPLELLYKLASWRANSGG